jgi:hypothetical protein
VLLPAFPFCAPLSAVASFLSSIEFACCFAAEEIHFLEEMFEVSAKSKIGVWNRTLRV